MTSEVNNTRDGQGKLEDIVQTENKIQRRINPPEEHIDLKIVDFYPEDVGDAGRRKGVKNLGVKNAAHVGPYFFYNGRLLL